jgi:hypothetical protein
MGKLNESFDEHSVEPISETIFDLPDEASPGRTHESAPDTLFNVPRETLAGTTRKPVPDSMIDLAREVSPENTSDAVPDTLFDIPREASPESAREIVPETTLALPLHSSPRLSGEAIPDTIYNLPREALMESAAEPIGKDVPAPVANTFFLWLQRSLAVGSILAMIAFVFLSAMSAIRMVIEPATETDITNGAPTAKLHVTTSEDPLAPEVAGSSDESENTTNAQPTEELTQADGPFNFAEPSVPSPAPVKVARPHARPKRVTKRVQVAAYETSRPPSLRPPSLPPPSLEPMFIPTTLVIYVENGVIKTRIEPWIQTASAPKN